MRKSNGPRTEPCGTPESIGKFSVDDPLRSTRCLLLLKYLSKNVMTLPVAFCLTLEIKPCPTLADALDISRKTRSHCKRISVFKEPINFIKKSDQLVYCRITSSEVKK